jgi:hypothetical protein
MGASPIGHLIGVYLIGVQRSQGLQEGEASDKVTQDSLKQEKMKGTKQKNSKLGNVDELPFKAQVLYGGNIRDWVAACADNSLWVCREF